MPITDNNFTDAELISAIDAKPDLIATVTKALGTKEYSIRSKADEATYVKNLETQHVSAHVSRFATELEKNVETLTGIKKAAPDEKYTDYYQRAFKSLAEENKLTKAEIADLKSKTDLSAAERDRLKSLEALATTTKAELDKERSERSFERDRLKSENQIINAITPIRNKLVKGDARVEKAASIVHDNVIADMLNSAKINPDTNKPIFYKDGKALIDNATGSYLTAEQVYTAAMKDFIETPKNQGGAGGQGDGNNNSGNAPAGVETKSDLHNYLAKEGLVAGKADYQAAWKKFGGDKLRAR